MKSAHVLHMLFMTRRVCSGGTNSARNRPTFDNRNQFEISNREKSAN